MRTAFSSGGTHSPHWNRRLALLHNGSMLLVVRCISESSAPIQPPLFPVAAMFAAPVVVVVDEREVANAEASADGEGGEGEGMERAIGAVREAERRA